MYKLTKQEWKDIIKKSWRETKGMIPYILIIGGFLLLVVILNEFI